MSVITEADEKLDAARENVRAAIDNLAAIIVTECHGAQAFTGVFRDTMHSCMNNLITIRQRLR